MRSIFPTLALVVAGAGLGMPVGALAGPLPSWNVGAAKGAIIEFVEGVIIQA